MPPEKLSRRIHSFCIGIAEFERECEEAEYTDVGELSELMKQADVLLTEAENALEANNL